MPLLWFELPQRFSKARGAYPTQLLLFSTKQTPPHPKPMTSIRSIKQVMLLFLLILMFSVFNNAHAKVKNIKPVASPGSPQSVVINSTVTLDGSQSSDSDGTIKKWQWTQTKGTKVKLLTPKLAQTSFTSPKLKAKTTSAALTFKLTVTDDKKATAAATVQITVNAVPVCIRPQILQNNVCVTPPPVCVLPKILINGVCVAPPVVCQSPQIPINNVCVTPKPFCTAPLIFKNGYCVVPPLACDLPLVLKDGLCVTPAASAPFNDTGLTDCSDGGTNIPACGIARFPQQDAEFGRDVTHYNDSDGHAGFSFTKISDAGAELPADAGEWSCVKDNITGLLWENKTSDGGLHDKIHIFSNYSLAFDPKNEYATATDATGFVSAVNNEGWCGVNNWRLPSTEELQGIVDFSMSLPGPAIDQNFFTNTRNNIFWTASALPRTVNDGWAIYFDDGRVFQNHRDQAEGGSVRLVSGTPNTHTYSISSDGQEVTDNATGLIWQRCVEGKQWDGSSCIGNPDGFMFEEALQRAESKKNYSDKNWRLPNIKEMAGLIDTSSNKIILFDDNAFPGSPNDQYWTSSSYSTDAFFAWVVHSFYGWVYYTYTEDTGVVRLVRDKD